MKLQRLRRSNRFFAHTEGLLRRNAVLVCGLGLPFVVMAATSLKSGVALAIGMYFAVVPSTIFMSFIGERIPAYIRIMISAFVSLAFITIAGGIIKNITPEIFDWVGIYLPLMAVNSISIHRHECYAKKNRWYLSLLDGFLFSSGFALVTLVVSLLREFLGSGNIWGVSVMSFRMSAFGAVFMGFILLAFLAAGAQAARRVSLWVAYRRDNPGPKALLRQKLERGEE